MKNGKYSARRSGSKMLVLALALVLTVSAVVGGTLAWLTDKTDEVKNTFTTADIDIELIETKKPDGTEVVAGVTDWSAALIPGFTYSKNPKVTVKANSVDCYLFVKFEETNNPSTYLTYTSTLTAANGWTQGDGTDIPASVWYREVTSSTVDQEWSLLKDNTVSVKDTVKDMPTNNPELAYTAYASQLYKSAGVEFSAKEAWDNVNPGN